jgi:hypothetical protein
MSFILPFDLMIWPLMCPSNFAGFAFFMVSCRASCLAPLLVGNYETIPPRMKRQFLQKKE